MKSPSVVDPRQRLRRIVQNAIAGGAVFLASRSEEDGRALVVDALRPDGTCVTLRFRGVHDAQVSAPPAEHSTLRLVSVGDATGFSLLRLLYRRLGPGAGALRVKIDAGTARLDVVCEDAEWWEDAPDPRSTGLS